MNKEKWEFSKELLNNIKINNFAVLEWAIWTLCCWVANNCKGKSHIERKEIINKIINREIDKWYL